MKIGKKELTKKQTVIGGIVLAALLLLGISSPYTLFGAGKTYLVKVPAGSTNESVVDSIKANIGGSYASRVKTMLGLLGADMSTRQGAWRISKGDSPIKAAHRLKSGAQSGIKFTFNNVRTKQEWAERWGAKFAAGKDAMLRALNDPRLCMKEGKTPDNITSMLIPDTYEFYWDITPEQMLDRMHDYYEKFWTPERRAKADSLGLTPEEVSIIASIAEEETSKKDELGKVARLYINRYKKGMRLQADPTIKFALDDFSIKRITTEMTQVKSPYNTYRIDGLPPGPIRMSEKSALDAVLDAPKHDYIYMCAKSDFSGYHDFTSDYNEHIRYAKAYRAELDKKGIK